MQVTFITATMYVTWNIIILSLEYICMQMQNPTAQCSGSLNTILYWTTTTTLRFKFLFHYFHLFAVFFAMVREQRARVKLLPYLPIQLFNQFSQERERTTRVFDGFFFLRPHNEMNE